MQLTITVKTVIIPLVLVLTKRKITADNNMIIKILITSQKFKIVPIKIVV